METADTVTISKNYLKTILRRAEFYTNGAPLSSALDIMLVSKAEHERLLKAAHEYNTLKTALFRGGLTAETLNILISQESQHNDNIDFHNGEKERSWADSTPNFARPTLVPVTISSPDNAQSSNGFFDKTGSLRGGHAYPSHSYSRSTSYLNRNNSFGVAGSSVDSPNEHDDHFSPDDSAQQNNGTQPYPRNAQRTLCFTGLADRTTHKHLTSIIKGGALLDIYIRNDRTATVAFADPAAANEFLAYAKRKDLYLNMKRIQVQWNDRQFHLPGHVANKISQGASRNIVIRNGASKLTEEGIRDDLEHIHNLIVIDVSFRGNDVYISTNSVHNALFARTCMMSRATYKGMKIEYYPDECAEPILKDTYRQRPQYNTEPAKKPMFRAPITNMFSALALDETEDGSDESDLSDDEPTTTLSGFDGVGLNWATANPVLA